MIIDLDKIKQLLDTESVSKIHHETGISRNAIYGYRNGKRDFDNFNVKTIKRLQKYINQQEHDQE